MAAISWTGAALATFSPEELDCAARGGSWDRATQVCTYPPGGFVQPPPPIITPPVGSQGTVDPEQMFADGFVYVNGRWVRADSPEASVVLVAGASTVSSAQTIIPGGTVLGTEVPAAPPVLLPSFVGGRLGRVEIAEGMRPQSGGRERVKIGWMPEVRGLRL